MKTPRSKQFIEWLKKNNELCERCLQRGFFHRSAETAHPRKSRPWGGGMGQKASDFGSLRLCKKCHDLEHQSHHTAWTDRLRDMLALRNLMAYAEHLDPGIDLLSELLEQGQRIIIELERGES